MLEIIAALIAGLFSGYAIASQQKGTYVTADRKEWRDFIRNWQVEVKKVINQNKSNLKTEQYHTIYANKLEYLIISICSRLNPIDDRDLIDKIKKMTIDDADNKVPEIFEELNILLKNDWERVKIETSFLGNGTLLNYFFLLYFPFLILNNLDYFFQYDFEKAAVFYSIFIGLFVICKIFYSELMKISSIRTIAHVKIFSRKNITLKFNFFDLSILILFNLVLPELNAVFMDVSIQQNWLFVLIELTVGFIIGLIYIIQIICKKQD